MAKKTKRPGKKKATKKRAPARQVKAVKARKVFRVGTVIDPLGISGTPTTVGTQSAPIVPFTVTGTGGHPPYSYSLAAGTFPTGVTLNSSSGVVSGTPTNSGTFAGLVIRVTDSQNFTADWPSFTLTIAAAGTDIVVADQTIPFGRLTKVGAGAYQVVANQTIVGIGSGLSGTNHGDFTISSSGVITPTVTPLVNGPYTLSCTFTGADSSTDSATFTINIEANTYSIKDATELAAVIAIGVATVSGKTIKGRGGSYVWTNSTLNARSFTSETILTSHDDANRPNFLIPAVELRSPTNLTLRGLDFTANFVSGTHLSTTPAMALKNTIGNFKIDDCHFTGNVLALANSLGLASTPQTWFGLIGCDGTTVISGAMEVTDCIFNSSRQGIHAPPTNGTTGSLLIEGNEIYDIQLDFIFLSSNTHGTPSNLTIRGNSLHGPLMHTSINDHIDFIQFVVNTGSVSDPRADVNNVLIENNYCYAGRDDSYDSSTRHDAQGIFLEDISRGNGDNYNYRDVTIRGNFIYTGNSVHGISLYNSIDGVIEGNTVAYDTAWISAGPSPPTLRPQINFKKQWDGTGSDNVAQDNASLAVASDWGDTTQTNNKVITPLTSGQATSYNTSFNGPTFTSLATLTAAQSAFARKSGGQLDPNLGALPSYTP